MLYIDEIMQAVESSDVENALKLFDKHRINHGDEPEYIAAQAIFYVQTQELETACEILLEGIAKHPQNTDLLYNLGYVYQALGLYTEALEYYERSMASTDNTDLIDEIKQLCAEIDATPEFTHQTRTNDIYISELISGSDLKPIGVLYNDDHDVPEIISELIKLLPQMDKPGLIIIKANAAKIYELQRDRVFIKEFAKFRIGRPKAGYLTIDTSKLIISTISQDELIAMDFEFDTDAVTSEMFRKLVRRLALGIKPEQTKKALSAAFRTRRLNDEEVAAILHATWIDMSKLSEITDLIS